MVVTGAHARRHLLLEMEAGRRQREAQPLFPALGQPRASVCLLTSAHLLAPVLSSTKTGPSNLLARNVELHLIKSIYTETRLIKSLLPRSPLFVFT